MYRALLLSVFNKSPVESEFFSLPSESVIFISSKESTESPRYPSRSRSAWEASDPNSSSLSLIDEDQVLISSSIFPDESV